MKNCGIFYGTDTGNTEKIAKIIQKELEINEKNIFDISSESVKKMDLFEKIFIGIPTWYYGELQCDWEDSLNILKKMNFKKKKVALFGCGDQEDYSEYFCDAIGIMYKVLKKNNANFFGKWSVSGYFYDSSKAEMNKDFFLGLPIDEDRQPELTLKRIKKWLFLTVNDMKKNIFF